ncbi:hypothetical protein LTR15_004643 [Elasticomyces elasticus]|nr:hypothetical protein LTR15_004643 [Elasticomyces elasticus]
MALTPAWIPDGSTKLMDALKASLVFPEFTDLIIKCDGRQWRVHRLIVCAQSPFFVKACAGIFKEATEGVITLKEDKPAVVDAMINYFYTFDYNSERNNGGTNEMSALEFDVHVLLLADKYDIPDLARLTTTKFKKRAQNEWKSTAFANAAGLVFAAGFPVDPLRDIVVQIAMAQAKELDKGDVGRRFYEIASSTPALAVALWRKRSIRDWDELSGYQWYTCPKGCGTSVYTELSSGYQIWCKSCEEYTGSSLWALKKF